MTQPKRPLKVFLCHAHADRDPVRALYTRLTNDGVDAWLDKEKLLGGQNWRMEIQTAVEEADVVVVCHSKEFNKEGFRQREVKWALDAAMEKPEGEIFIIPVRLEECEVIKSLREWHWVDLFEDDGYKMLMRALRARANNIGATLLKKESELIQSAYQKLGQKEEILVQMAVDTAKQYAQEEVRKSNREIERKQKRDKFNLYIRSKTSIFLYNFRRLFFPVTLFVGSIIVVAYFGKSTFDDLMLRVTPPVSLTPKLNSGLMATQTDFVSDITPVPTSLPTEITDAKGVAMVLVPAGEFTMGSNNNNFDSVTLDEQPIHIVDLDAFYIDKYEVTNSLYSVCVDAGVCSLPTDTVYYANLSRQNHPIVYVDWYMAKQYCDWREGRLPTEAEWEKAARGKDGRLFPWEGDISCLKANYLNFQSPCVGDTTVVGTYLDGVSPYGLFDMAGNVLEWTNSLSLDYPYNPNDGREDLSTSGQRVLRGGSRNTVPGYVTTTTRFARYPSDDNSLVGFRCAKNATP